VDWIQDNDGEIKDMYFETYVENFRGIHASKDIKKGTMILFVPY
jgi:sialic acid synthase SpsE